MIKLRECLMEESRRSCASGAWLAAAVVLLGSALLLTGCSSVSAIAVVEPTATVYAPPPTDIPAPPSGPTPEAYAFPLPAPTHGYEVPVSDENCVTCHTNEEMLRAVAEEDVEEPDGLSAGEG